MLFAFNSYSLIPILIRNTISLTPHYTCQQNSMIESFHIYTDISYLPIHEYETYLEEGLGGICTGGTALIKVSSVCQKLSKNDLITILPLQLAQIQEMSADFGMTFFKVSKVMFEDVMSGMGKVTPDFFFFMRTNFLAHLEPNDARRFLGFCRVIDYRESNVDSLFWRETVLHLLRIYYWDFYVHFQKVTGGKVKSYLNSNKENIAFKFSKLVFEYSITHREIVFYAGKLCISPLYLTKVIQEVNGRSPREVIAEHVIVEIKRMLRDAKLDIKEIVHQTGFSNHSSMSRFFRQNTGMSPSEYRRTIHIIR